MNLFKSILDMIVGKETEEKKLKKEAHKRLIDSQNNVISNMKCPICEHTEFDNGSIGVSGSGAVAISNINTYSNDHNKHYRNKVLVCNNCGYVLIFADFKNVL